MSRRCAAVMLTKARRMMPRDERRNQEPWMFLAACAERLAATGSLPTLGDWAVDLATPVSVVREWHAYLALRQLLGSAKNKPVEPGVAVVGEVLRAARPAGPDA